MLSAVPVIEVARRCAPHAPRPTQRPRDSSTGVGQVPRGTPVTLGIRIARMPAAARWHGARLTAHACSAGRMDERPMPSRVQSRIRRRPAPPGAAHHGRTARPDSKPSGPERAAASRSPHRRETPHRPRAGLQSPDHAPPREWIDPAPARGDCLAFEAILWCLGLCSLKPRDASGSVSYA